MHFREITVWFRRNIGLLLAGLLLAVGLAYVAVPRVQSAWVRKQGASQNKQLLAETPVASTPIYAYTFGQPRALELPRLGITLGIMPGTYNKGHGTWTLDRTHAFVMSGDSQAATPVIYGHNIPAVFARLDGVAAEEPLQITMSDGRVLLYRYSSELIVAPDDTGWLRKKIPEAVLVMTCTGPTFKERRVLQFQFVGEVRTVTLDTARGLL